MRFLIHRRAPRFRELPRASHRAANGPTLAWHRINLSSASGSFDHPGLRIIVLLFLAIFFSLLWTCYHAEPRISISADLERTCTKSCLVCEVCSWGSSRVDENRSIRTKTGVLLRVLGRLLIPAQGTSVLGWQRVSAFPSAEPRSINQMYVKR